jgi:hypothetical protein
MKTAKQLVNDSKHFCVLPWIHFHAWPDKKVMPCCIADSEQPVSEIKPGESILDLMNSDEYKKMRLAMLNDEKYEACTRCYDLEDNGTWTLRNSQNKVRGLDSVDLIEMTNADGSIDEFKLKYMDMRFSNLCNYKCRSCGPGCSNLWGEEKLKIISEDDFVTKFGRKETLVTCTEETDFMDNLKPYLNDVEECYFAGGEILVTPEHYECMDYWIENGLADKVNLNYTTNMSILSHKVDGKKRDLFEMWKHFPNIEIWASIDAIGEQGELVRKGFKWKKVQENLLRIRDEAPNIKLGITPTISVWNIFNYCEMFDWMYKEGFISAENPPRLNILTYPDWASITVLPMDARKKLIQKFKGYIAKFAGKDEDIHLRNDFRVLVQTLWSGKDDKAAMRKFFQENDQMDGFRNEELDEVVPQLKEVREWCLEL